MSDHGRKRCRLAFPRYIAVIILLGDGKCDFPRDTILTIRVELTLGIGDRRYRRYVEKIGAQNETVRRRLRIFRT